MKEVYDKIYGLYNEILKIPMDSPKYFELYKEYIKLLILVILLLSFLLFVYNCITSRSFLFSSFILSFWYW